MADEKLRAIISAIFDTHLDSIIDCDTCSRQFHCLADMVAQGADSASLLPAVEAHLRCCPDCREEFNFLVTMLKADIAENNPTAEGIASAAQNAALSNLAQIEQLSINED
ncbi:MAG: hypothetical protein SGI73_17010 [Chloroflexota bacterium]|nr:hypothetical protein [Chloroflexota bacterium]